MLKPCRSPYCECTKYKCTHPGYYDARHVPFKWKGNQMESFDSKLRQLLNMFGIDSDTGIPDYILEQFICKTIDSLTECYQAMPENRGIADITKNSEMYAKLVSDYSNSLIQMQTEIRIHKGIE